MKKEHTKEWGGIEKVKRIEHGDIPFYVLEGGTRGFMRHELLKVEARDEPSVRVTSEAPRRRLVGKQRNPRR